MFFYIKLAWRNMFRNKRRTIIAALAIGIGLASLIVGSAIIRGMSANMIKSVTTSFLGEAQIHGKGFREAQEVEKTVKNLDSVVSKLKADPLVDNFTLRTLSMGTLTSPANVNAILVVGVQPESEQFLSKIDNAIVEGDFFGIKGPQKKGNKLSEDAKPAKDIPAGKSSPDREGSPLDIIIGSKLAEILEVGVGDRVVVTVAQAETGALSQEMFRISGIYRFNVRELDTGMAFIRIGKAKTMLNIGESVHEIVVKFNNIKTASRNDISFWEDYSRDGNEAVSWGTLVPSLKAVTEMMGMMRFIMVLILAAVVIFGIINTMFMSLYERMFEFAVMRAVGTRAGGLRKLILLEAGALAVISIIIGVILGLVLGLYLGNTGLDYRGLEYAGAAISEMIYPEMKTIDFISYPVGLLFFTVVVGIYPAWVAGKLKLADALRKSL